MPFGDGKGHRRNSGQARGRRKSKNCVFGKGIFSEMRHRVLQRNVFNIQTDILPQSTLDPQKNTSTDQDLDVLKQRSKILQNKLDSILSRIDPSKDKEIQKSISKIIACVIESKCTGCGICLNSCNRGAITLDNTAKIIIEKCTGCGVCVNACPNEALFLKEYEN